MSTTKVPLGIINTCLMASRWWFDFQPAGQAGQSRNRFSFKPYFRLEIDKNR
ncbi:10848_t:CDS:1, partial [Dentiscutata heterogama]